MPSCPHFYCDLVALFVIICTYLQYILSLTIKGLHSKTTAFTFATHYQTKDIFNILLIAVKFSLLDVLYEVEESSYVFSLSSVTSRLTSLHLLSLRILTCQG